jgi:hypothetical protein
MIKMINYNNDVVISCEETPRATSLQNCDVFANHFQFSIFN